MSKKKVITKELREGKPIYYPFNGGCVHLSTDGRLWVNDELHCVVRISGLPRNAKVVYNPDSQFLDITF